MNLNCLAYLHATSILVIFNNKQRTFLKKKLNILGHSDSQFYSFRQGVKLHVNKITVLNHSEVIKRQNFLEANLPVSLKI